MNTSTSLAAKPTPEWTDYIRDSVQEVFGMMLGLGIERFAQVETPPCQITSIVGLAGALRGLFMIRCSTETAAFLACKMLGTEQPGSDAEVRDAIGEICNMLAGSFKSKIPGLDEHCILSVPTTISGESYEIQPRGGGPEQDMVAIFEGSLVRLTVYVTE
jgi:CheY-specific phosphatase CheX